MYIKSITKKLKNNFCYSLSRISLLLLPKEKNWEDLLIMKKMVTATIATLSLGAVGIAQSEAEASENTQSSTQYANNQSTNSIFEYGYIDEDNNGNYHHTLDGNWDQSMFDQEEYYFYLIDSEGNYHYYYFPMNNQGVNTTNATATNATATNATATNTYEDNNYSADKSHEEVQENGYDVNEAPAQPQEAPQSSNNEVSAQTSSQEQTASNNNSQASNESYENSYTRNDGNGAENVNQNATSNNVNNTTNAPATETTNESQEAQTSQKTQTSPQEAPSSNDSQNKTSSNSNNSTSSSNWLTSNSQMQPYGQYHGGGAHYGVDYAMDENTPVYSLTDGTVIQSGWSNYGGGNQVTIQEENSDNYQWYMHMNSLNVEKGDQVQEGQQIGESGSTGNSTAPHLHFQRMEGGIGNSYSVDPTSYVNSKA